MENYNKKSETVLNTFNKIAKQYIDYFGCDLEFIDEINHFASFLKPDSIIVDLGCGSEYITNLI